MNILSELNPEQKSAAEHTTGPMLILAGAGSGKTKTITIRTAYLISKGVPGDKILTLTFTNKAAREMNERGMKILYENDIQCTQPEFTTFHSWSLKFIRNYIQFLDEIDKDFTIADESNAKAIIRKTMDLYKVEETYDDIKDGNISSIFSIIQNNLIPYDTEESSIKAIRNLYNKDNLNIFFEKNFFNTDERIKLLGKIFYQYKKELRENNLVDFDDLINLSVKILENDNVRRKMQEKYEYIMVDEFQDTNYAQIKLLDALINEKNNIVVVGDDSQSIYGWRGADIKHILKFHERFVGTKVVNLISNYRSTPDIVKKANKLLDSAKEKHDLKEKLKAFRKEDGEIVIKSFKYNNAIKKSADVYENEYVATKIKELIDDGVKPSEIAILYRINAIYKNLEAKLIAKRIPYQIYKGRSLFERKSIKEILELIKFLINEKNAVSLEDFLTSTVKIISKSKLDEIVTGSLDKFILKRKYKQTKLPKKNIEKLDAFVDFCEEAKKLIEDEAPLEETISYIFQYSGLIQEYKRIIETTKSVTTRDTAERALDDLDFIYNTILQFESLRNFYEDITLAPDDAEKSDDEKIKLMTVHSSKGLEFEYVFVIRFNQGIFPSQRSFLEGTLEEERRLAYVAITRAKKFLSLSYVDFYFGRPAKESQFIKEAGLSNLLPQTVFKRY